MGISSWTTSIFHKTLEALQKRSFPFFLRLLSCLFLKAFSNFFRSRSRKQSTSENGQMWLRIYFFSAYYWSSLEPFLSSRFRFLKKTFNPRNGFEKLSSHTRSRENLLLFFFSYSFVTNFQIRLNISTNALRLTRSTGTQSTVRKASSDFGEICVVWSRFLLLIPRPAALPLIFFFSSLRFRRSGERRERDCLEWGADEKTTKWRENAQKSMSWERRWFFPLRPIKIASYCSLWLFPS